MTKRFECKMHKFCIVQCGVGNTHELQMCCVLGTFLTVFVCITSYLAAPGLAFPNEVLVGLACACERVHFSLNVYACICFLLCSGWAVLGYHSFAPASAASQ